MNNRRSRRLVWLNDHVPQLHRLWLWLWQRAMRRISRQEQQQEQQQR